MSDLFNLRRARKVKRKSEARATAAENRVKFGRSKSVKAMDAAARLKAKMLLDQAKREP